VASLVDLVVPGQAAGKWTLHPPITPFLVDRYLASSVSEARCWLVWRKQFGRQCD
jgi:hypothetical protein